MTAGTRISDAPDHGDDKRRDLAVPSPGGGAGIGCPIVIVLCLVGLVLVVAYIALQVWNAYLQLGGR